MSPGSGPGPRLPGPGLWDPGNPVPDADPWHELLFQNDEKVSSLF